MKFLNIISKYQVQISWLIIGILLYLLLFAKGCTGNRDEKLKAIAAENKQLKDKVAADSIARNNERIAEKDKIDKANERAKAAIRNKETSDRKLTQTQSTVVQLARRLQLITNKPDSSFTDYVNNCDTLAEKVIEQDKQINAYKKEVDEVMDLLNYEVVLRDSVIEKEVAYSDSLRADFNRQSQLLKSALSAGKPRGKLLAGAGVIGNQTMFLSGAKVVAAYQTKGGKQYQGGAILMNKTIYYEMAVMVPLFK